MNKNRYKLIFSKTRCCLIPVAEYIKSALGSTSKAKESDKKTVQQAPEYRKSSLSDFVAAYLNPIKTVDMLKSKRVSLLLLTVLSPAAFAEQGAVLDPNNHNTKIKYTENKVLIVDVAKPGNDGISDNHFSKFNVENGSVFNNSLKEGNSYLVGHLEKNQNFDKQSAKAILTQVTGSEMSKIRGGLEVFGDKADLLLVNPNGININGVQTFNTDRFVVSTSEVAKPENGVNLSVTRGKVTIDEDGLATDGLKYLDIVAKKIEQKGAIRHAKESKDAQQANITLAAGSSEFNVRDSKLTAKNDTSNEVAISGSEAGAMYGNHIQLITTDSGAGVNHKGIILSESDIALNNKAGKVEINTIQSKGNIYAEGSQAFSVTGTLNSDKNIRLDSKNVTVDTNAKVSAKTVNITRANTVQVKENAKIAGPQVDIHSNTTTVAAKAKVTATRLTVKGHELENNGSVSSRYGNIDVDRLINRDTILAQKDLYIATKGMAADALIAGGKLHGFDLDKLKHKFEQQKNGFQNSGTIQSLENATLTFKDKTNYFSALHQLPQAKGTLTFSANRLHINNKADLQTEGSLNLHGHEFSNDGVLASGKQLSLNITNNINNSGLLGARERLALTSEQGNIINNAGGVFHSEGDMALDAHDQVYNAGDILAKRKLTISAQRLLNDVILNKNDVSVIGKQQDKIHNHYGRTWTGVYRFWSYLPEFKNDLQASHLGKIRSEGGLTFNQKDSSHADAGIINHGIINIRGTFENNGTKQIINNMKSVDKTIVDYLKQPSRALLSFYPKFNLFGTALAGEAIKEFHNLFEMIDYVLSQKYALHTGLYTSERDQVFKLLKSLEHPQLQQVLTAALGQNWEGQSMDTLARNWQRTKEGKTPALHFYPAEQAKILADNITGSADLLRNGERAENGEFNNEINVGKHKLDIPAPQFKSFIAEAEQHSGIDLSVLAELLANPNLFIDRSLQLEKPKHQPTPHDQDDDKLLQESEEEKRQRLERELEQARQEKLQAEKRHKELEAQKQKEKAQQEALERKKREDALHALQEKQRQEKEALERKLQAEKETQNRKQHEEELKALAEKHKKEQEALQQKLDAEKQAQLEKQRKEQEEQLRKLEEYKKKLEEARKKAEEFAKQREIPEQKNRPRVDVDPLYHTRMKYINQKDYVGGNYFFNKIAPKTESGKVNTVGDAYFEHQLITRTIEKKVDNHLALKYNLTNVQLVKRLMDNAYHSAKDLHLTLGQALTKEQQDNLKEDIVWYVKSTVNGKEVYVPQVYFAKQTLEDAAKYKGFDTALIKAREAELKTKQVENAGSISGNKINIEAENKIKNQGSIQAQDKLKLKGHKGIESTAKTYVDDKGNTTVEKSKIKSDKHLHLETDLDSNVDLKGADVKAKSGYVRTKDLNVKDTHETQSSHKSTTIPSDNGLNGSLAGGISEDNYTAKSVGSKAEFDHLHLAVAGNVSQEGSKIKTNRTTGIVQGHYVAKGGKNLSHSETEKNLAQNYGSAEINGFGYGASASVDQENGATTAAGRSNGAGASAEYGLSFTRTKTTETKLQHSNSELDAKSGHLHIQKDLDIGGLDINKSTPATPSEKTEKDDALKPQPKAKSAVKNPQKKDNPAFKKLSDEEVANLMAEKDESFFEAQKDIAAKEEKAGFKLSADRILSTKQKNEIDKTHESSKFSLGMTAEAHSSALDAAANIAKQVRDSKKGIKQDATAALQYASDVANLVTGDLVGGSVKAQIGYSKKYSESHEVSDNKNTLNGKLTFTARSGDATFNNVESNKETTDLTINAKGNVNVNAGETRRTESEQSESQKFSLGISAACGIAAQGCAAGASAKFEMSTGNTKEQAITYQNSKLKGKRIEINSDGDFNLSGGNIEADKYITDIKGKTNIESKQDSYKRDHNHFDLSASVGASVSSAGFGKPSGSFGANIGKEKEESHKVNEQSGIKAKHISGTLNDVNLKAGYIVDESNSNDLEIKGKITHQNLKDSHHKDGGKFGATIGANKDGVKQLDIRGSRSEQLHYEATQQSTIAGVKTNQQSDTPINQDLSKSKSIQRNDKYASTKFQFETLDITNMAKKGIEKAQKLKQHTENPAHEETPQGTGDQAAQHRSSQEAVYSTVNKSAKPSAKPRSKSADDAIYSQVGDKNAAKSRSKSVDEPIYSQVGDKNASKPRSKSADEPIYSEIGDKNAAKQSSSQEAVYSTVNKSAKPSTKPRSKSADEAIYSQVGDKNASKPRSKSANEPIYEEIPQGTYSQVGDKNAAKPRSNSADEPIYEEIPQGTYSQVGDKNAAKPRSKSADEPIYEEIPQSIYSKVGDKNAAKPRSKSADEPIYSEVGDKNAAKHSSSQEAVYSTVNKSAKPSTKPRSKSADEPIYSEIGDKNAAKQSSSQEAVYSTVNKSAKPSTKPRSKSADEAIYSQVGDKNASKPRSKSADEPIYEEIPQSIYSKVGDKNAAKPRSKSADEPIYEEIPQGTYSQVGDKNAAKPRSKSANEPIYEEIPQGTYSQVGDKNAAKPRAKSADEPIYEEIPQGTYSQVGDKNAAKPRSKSADEPIYEEIPQSIYSQVGDKNAAKPRSKSADEPIYEEIPQSIYSKVGDKNAAKPRSKSADELIYEEIPQSIYSKVGDKNAAKPRSKSAEEPIYEEIPQSTYSQVGDKNASKPRSKSADEPIYEEIPQGTYSQVGDKNASKPRSKSADEPIYSEVGDKNVAKQSSSQEAVYSTVNKSAKPSAKPRSKSADEPIYEEIPQDIYSQVGDKNAAKYRSSQEAIYSKVNKRTKPSAKPRSKSADEPIYEEIPQGTYSQVGDKNATKPRAKSADEPIYEEIPDTTLKTNLEYKLKAKRALPELP
ncbi:MULTISPECIES: two-partner secretion domain-containing protein [Pasteurellaceae]|uniref:two-partner secretion domain-containing protein n=1 Tax=Pasteurellaceae TaxID=712 RepID=UPI0035614C3D